jgi:hypothetical protein
VVGDAESNQNTDIMQRRRFDSKLQGSFTQGRDENQKTEQMFMLPLRSLRRRVRPVLIQSFKAVSRNAATTQRKPKNQAVATGMGEVTPKTLDLVRGCASLPD